MRGSEMIAIRKSQERGYAEHGWLKAYHSFSFAEYYDPAHMHYSVLRVINEDRIAGGAGFGMHSHRDMEIVTFIIEGELRHQDSMGNTSVIRAGDVQRMTAGSGVRHSEVNSGDSEVHLLQIWIVPNQEGLIPSYEEKHFSAEQRAGRWCLLVSPNGHDDALTIHQDVQIYTANLNIEQTLDIALVADRCAYLQVVQGLVQLNGISLEQGDAVMLENESELKLIAEQEAALILFDLPKL
jgi:quercetin 2,3-dioxygenase